MGEPRLSLREAATATGVSLSTIKRRRAAGDFPNAGQDASGAWQVPASDLIGAGLELGQGGSRPRSWTGSWPRSESPVTQGHDLGVTGDQLAEAQATIAKLTAELADMRSARQVAEATVAAYARNLDDLRRNAEIQTLALRALTGPPADDRGSDADPGARAAEGSEESPSLAPPVLRAVPSGPAAGGGVEPARRKWWQRRA